MSSEGIPTSRFERLKGLLPEGIRSRLFPADFVKTVEPRAATTRSSLGRLLGRLVPLTAGTLMALGCAGDTSIETPNDFDNSAFVQGQGGSKNIGSQAEEDDTNVDLLSAERNMNVNQANGNWYLAGKYTGQFDVRIEAEMYDGNKQLLADIPVDYDAATGEYKSHGKIPEGAQHLLFSASNESQPITITPDASGLANDPDSIWGDPKIPVLPN